MNSVGLEVDSIGLYSGRPEQKKTRTARRQALRELGLQLATSSRTSRWDNPRAGLDPGYGVAGASWSSGVTGSMNSHRIAPSR
jgi:hypothetical protein